MRVLFLTLLISFSSLASTQWYDLNQGQTYELEQSFSLTQKGPSAGMLDVMAGEKLFLKEIAHLPMISVSLFIFDYKNCPGPQMLTEMEIIPVQETRPLVEVGIQLEANCSLEIYIETKDLMSPSFLQE